MEENKQKKIIDATILIAIIPAYIYFITFEYEFGYCNHFGIPKYLIEPCLTTILIFATSLFGILFSSVNILGLSLPFFNAVKNENKKHLKGINLLNGIIVVIGILMLIIYPFSWRILIYFLIFALLVNLLTWGIPFLFLIRKKKSLKEKLQQIEDERPNGGKYYLLSNLLQKFDEKETNFIFILLMIPFFCFFFGDAEATKQKTFQTISTKENTVILKKYNDIFVCAKFNRKTKEISDTLLLVKFSENEPLSIKTEEIGPLLKK